MADRPWDEPAATPAEPPQPPSIASSSAEPREGTDAESDEPHPPEPLEPDVRVTAEPGRGLTVSVGDAFSAQLRARVQLRGTVRVDGAEHTNIEVRTARIWWTGHVLDPRLRYGLQLALGANDFEPGNPSPLFDAFVDLAFLRDLNVRIGQFFVPFDRARTVRESSLMTLDRTDVVRELTLDRDVGVVIGSSDLFGLGGALSYALGFFGGDGRNRIGLADPGFLYTARVSVRPFGEFDDDAESDLSRSPSPRLAIGGAIAFNHQTDRPRSTTGAPYVRARFDYLHLAGDLVFKFAGVSLLAEVVWRDASADRAEWIDDGGQLHVERSRSGFGYLAQLGVLVYEGLELWSRWEHSFAREGTDPALVSQVDALGHGLAVGANYYFNGHALKVQAEWAHSFGASFDGGVHLARLQLDASF